MGRLFTFGCSFTNYWWPTWADIMHSQYHGENWGMPGGGNKFIFESLIECMVTNNINKDDTVIIMWSSWSREDRYINGFWYLYGTVYNNRFYDEAFLKKYWSDEGAILDSLNWMSASCKMLDLIGCKYIITSAYPFYMVKEYAELGNLDQIVDVSKYNKYLNYLENYKEHCSFNNLYQNKYENDFIWQKSQWSDKPVKDNHPFPWEHFLWLEESILPKLNLNSDEIDNLRQTAKAMDDQLRETAKNNNYVHFDLLIPKIESKVIRL